MNIKMHYLVSGAILLAGIFSTVHNVHAQRFAITECPGLVTEPGTYVLRNDIAAMDDDSCFVVRTSDVTIRLSGLTITAPPLAIDVYPDDGGGPGFPSFDRIEVLGPGEVDGAIRLSANEAIVRNVTFISGGVGGTVRNSKFEGNECVTISPSRCGLSFFSSDVSFGRCEDNRIMRNHVNSLSAINCDRTLIKNNIVDGRNIILSPLTQAGIELRGRGLHVVKNEVFDVDGVGVGLSGSVDEPSDGNVIEGNQIHDNEIGIQIGPAEQAGEEGIANTLVRKNRLEDNQDQINTRIPFFGEPFNTVFEMNLCDPPDIDPVCTSTFAPNEPVAAAAPSPASMQLPQFKQAPLLIMPLKKGRPIQ